MMSILVWWSVEQQDSRMLLCAAAEKIMRQSFDLLGIVTLDKI